MPQEPAASRADRNTVTAAFLILTAASAYIVVAPNVGIYYSEVESFDVWRVLQLVLLAGIAGAFALFRPVGELVGFTWSALPRGARRALAALAVLGVASSIASARPLYGLREVAQLTLLALLALAVAASARELGGRFNHFAAHAVAVCALFYLTIFLAVLLADPWGTSAWTANPLFGYPTPRFFGHLESWLLPLMGLPLTRRQPGRTLTYIGAWAAAVGWWMLLFVSGSRAPFLSIGVGAMAAVAILGWRSLPWLRAHAVAFVCGAAAYYMISRVLPSSPLDGALARGASDNGRFGLWKRAVAMLRESPLLGAGPEHFAFYRPAAGHSPAHPHNTALQWASEWGLPAALLLCGVLAWGLWSWARARRDDGRAPPDVDRDVVAAGLTAALFAATAHSFLDGMAVMPLPQTIGAVVVGWALGVHQSGRVRPAVAVRWSAAARIAALVAAVTLAAAATLPARPLAPREARAPRFWIHGGIP